MSAEVARIDAARAHCPWCGNSACVGGEMRAIGGRSFVVWFRCGQGHQWTGAWLAPEAHKRSRLREAADRSAYAALSCDATGHRAAGVFLRRASERLREMAEREQ